MVGGKGYKIMSVNIVIKSEVKMNITEKDKENKRMIKNILGFACFLLAFIFAFVNPLKSLCFFLLWIALAEHEININYFNKEIRGGQDE
jgi:hypothetical protein